MVKIGFESEQFASEIGSCPEQRTIQALSAERGNQSLYKGMGQGNIRDGFDLGHLQDSQVGLPLLKPIKGIVVGAEVLGHPALPSKGAVEHPAKCDTVDGPGMDAENTHPHHVQVGNWVREHRGIYRLALFPTAEQPDLVKWALWSRNRDEVTEGVYSHQTALGLYELSDLNPAKLHVTVPTHFRRSSENPRHSCAPLRGPAG